jgi:protein-disulfide isomerase
MPKNSTPPTPPKKSDRRFITVLAVLALIGAAAIGYVLLGKEKATSVVIDTTQPMPNAKGKVIGNDAAPVEIVMFGDFECPGCGQFADLTEYDIRNNLVVPGIARYRFADFPWVEMHKASMDAHIAAACANDQGQFWPMHDRIYHLRHEWSWFANGRDMGAPKIMKRYALELKLDGAKFDACFDNREHQAEIMESRAAGTKLGVASTPTIVVGKRMITSNPSYDVIKAYVDSALADAKSGR